MDIVKTKYLKFEIFSKSVRLSNKTKSKLGKSIKEQSNLRSGLSNGLDIILPNNIWVNAPIDTKPTGVTPFLVNDADGKFVLKKNGEKLAEILIPPRPLFYNYCTSDGVPFKKIGSIRADRLSICLNNNCIFWNNKKLRCKFCAIGLTKKNEIPIKTSKQILETVEAALNDPTLPAKHIYLNSGAQAGLDNGFSRFAKIISEIKELINVNVHLNPCPPRSKRYIDLLYYSKLDEISFNLEVFDEKVAKEIIPAKYSLITRELYFKMLNYAVEVFGDLKVSSCLVVGLEPFNSTIEGVEYLLSHGIIPKLSCFRPLSGSLLSKHPPPSFEFLVDVYNHAKELSREYGTPLGPLCQPCQLHSLI